MSQIDRLNFIPNFFWFLILFSLFYFLIFSYLVPSIYFTLKFRENFFFSLVKLIFALNDFLVILPLPKKKVNFLVNIFFGFFSSSPFHSLIK